MTAVLSFMAKRKFADGVRKAGGCKQQRQRNAVAAAQPMPESKTASYVVLISIAGCLTVSCLLNCCLKAFVFQGVLVLQALLSMCAWVLEHA